MLPQSPPFGIAWFGGDVTNDAAKIGAIVSVRTMEGANTRKLGKNDELVLVVVMTTIHMSMKHSKRIREAILTHPMAEEMVEIGSRKKQKRESIERTIHGYSHFEFRENFRLTRRVFERLCRNFKTHCDI